MVELVKVEVEFSLLLLQTKALYSLSLSLSLPLSFDVALALEIPRFIINFFATIFHDMYFNFTFIYRLTIGLTFAQ